MTVTGIPYIDVPDEWLETLITDWLNNKATQADIDTIRTCYTDSYFQTLRIGHVVYMLMDCENTLKPEHRENIPMRQFSDIACDVVCPALGITLKTSTSPFSGLSFS